MPEIELDLVAVAVETQRVPRGQLHHSEGAVFCNYDDEGRLIAGAPTTVPHPTQGAVIYCPPDQADFRAAEASPLGYSLRFLFTEPLLVDDVGDLQCDPTDPDAPPASGTLATSCPVRITCAPSGGTPQEVPYQAYYTTSGDAGTYPVGPALVVVPPFDATYAAGDTCNVVIAPSAFEAEGDPVYISIDLPIADLAVVTTEPRDAEAVADRAVLPSNGEVTFVFNSMLDEQSLDPLDFEIVQQGPGGISTFGVNVRPAQYAGLSTAVAVAGATPLDPGMYTVRVKDDATIRDRDGGTFAPNGQAVRFLVQGITAIDISPSPVTLADGQTRQITVQATFVDGATQDVTDSATFVSSSPAIAAISNAPQTRGMVTAEAPGSTTITATVGEVTDVVDVTVTDAILTSIATTPSAPDPVPVGRTLALSATGTYSNGNQSDVTELATWTSSAPNVASVSNDAGSRGEVLGVATGTTTITAAIGGVTVSTTVNVVPPVLTGIAINPDNPTLADGRTLQFTATGTYSAGPPSEIGGFCNWTGDNPDVALVSSSGHVNTLGPPDLGQVTVTCTLFGVTDTTTLTVGPAALDTIVVSPDDEMLPIGVDQPFAAVGIYSNNVMSDVTTTATWTATPASRIAIAPTTGLASIPNNATTGAATVTATIGAVSDSAPVTVIPAQLVSLVIAPNDPTIDTATFQLTVQGTYTDDSTADVTNLASWQSDDAGIASVDGSGLVTNVAPGTATITATLGQSFDSVVVTTVTPPAPEITVEGANGFIPQDGVDDAGNRTIGAAFSRTITIRNLGDANLSVTGVTPGAQTGCTASVSTQPSSPIAPADQSTFTVSVTPTAYGPFACAFTIVNGDADENSYVVAVVGEAGEPIGDFVSASYAGGGGCGLAAFDIDTDREILVPTFPDNPGTVLTLSPTVPDVATATNLVINGGGGYQCTFAISGSTLVIDCDDGNGGACQETASRVAAPEIDVREGAARLIDDDGVAYRYHWGSPSYPQQLVIENDGTAPLTLGTITVADGANCSGVVSQPPGTTTLAPGASTTFTVQIAPPSVGTYECTITIPTNDADENPFEIFVRGDRVASN